MFLKAAKKQEKNADLPLGEIRLKVEMVIFPGDVTAEAIGKKGAPLRLSNIPKQSYELGE